MEKIRKEKKYRLFLDGVLIGTGTKKEVDSWAQIISGKKIEKKEEKKTKNME